MSQPLTLARPYARAAFLLARDRQRLPQWSAWLEFAAQASALPALRAVLGHPKVGNDELVALIAPQDADQTFHDFLRALAENRRAALLPEIADLYAKHRAEAERVVKARLVTAEPAEAGQVEKIRAGLKRRFGREVELETSVDPSLIGGALIQSGDVVVDSSIRNKLDRLRAALMH